MNERVRGHALLFVAACIGALLGIGSPPAAAHELEQKTPEPGFRPPSDQAPAFLAAVGNTSIAVLPSVVRRVERTAHSFASQRQIAEFLSQNGIARASLRHERIDLGRLAPGSQWEIFQQGLSAAAGAIASRAIAADYVLVMEFLIPGDQSLFGIEVYILDAQGNNAFSFLLNSHHQLFAEARLVAEDTSEAARSKMLEDATRIGLVALQAQIAAGRECLAREAAPAATSSPGVLHDFDGALTAGIDAHGVPVGYSTFSGPDSTVSFGTTDSYPPRAGSGEGNRVLQLDLNVTSWGGVVNRFTDDAARNWIRYDWRQLGGLSFWFLGANSGAAMFFDVFDNRHPCSSIDDAERFRYRFWDDVSGWRQILIRFEDLARTDVGNQAPDDGLGLDKVHGWGLGTFGTRGPVKFYVDDILLLARADGESPRPAARIEHRLFVETRVRDDESRIEVGVAGRTEPVFRRTMELMCECARLTVERGFSFFRVDERELLSSDRGRFRLTFYASRPDGVAVLEMPKQPQDQELPEAVSAAIPARLFLGYCKP